MSNILPIVFKDRLGHQTDKFDQSAPLLDVAFRFDREHGIGAKGRIVRFDPIQALVDTGADLNYADPHLIEKYGCPVVGSASVSGATSTIPSTRHLCHLFFPKIGLQIETDVVASPLRANGRQYDLILGCLFLQKGVLHMDFQSKSFSFTLP